MRLGWALATSSPYMHPGEIQTDSRSRKMSRLSPGARQDPPLATPPSHLSQLSAEQFRIALTGFVFLVCWGPKRCNKSCVFFSSILGQEITTPATTTEHLFCIQHFMLLLSNLYNNSARQVLLFVLKLKTEVPLDPGTRPSEAQTLTWLTPSQHIPTTASCQKAN